MPVEYKFNLLLTLDAVIPAACRPTSSLIASTNPASVVTPVISASVFSFVSSIINVSERPIELNVPIAAGQLAFHASEPTSTHVPAAVSVRYFFIHSLFNVEVATIA